MKYSIINYTNIYNVGECKAMTEEILVEKIKFIEVEEQRLGRNKSTLVNHTYISQGSYKRKFDQISNNKDLSRLLFQLSKKMLKHRSGTKFEDMYWIDLNTLTVVAQESDSLNEVRVDYSQDTIKVIQRYDGLLTIHSHPNSFPPSIDDFNSNFLHNYGIGIIVCHDGKVFMYSANEEVSGNYYKLVVEGFLKQGYNEYEAQIHAIEELKRNFDIQFKEVLDYGSM